MRQVQKVVEDQLRDKEQSIITSLLRIQQLAFGKGEQISKRLYTRL